MGWDPSPWENIRAKRAEAGVPVLRIRPVFDGQADGAAGSAGLSGTESDDRGGVPTSASPGSDAAAACSAGGDSASAKVSAGPARAAPSPVWAVSLARGGRRSVERPRPAARLRLDFVRRAGASVSATSGFARGGPLRAVFARG